MLQRKSNILTRAAAGNVLSLQRWYRSMAKIYCP